MEEEELRRKLLKKQRMKREMEERLKKEKQLEMFFEKDRESSIRKKKQKKIRYKKTSIQDQLMSSIKMRRSVMAPPPPSLCFSAAPPGPPPPPGFAMPQQQQQQIQFSMQKEIEKKCEVEEEEEEEEGKNLDLFEEEEDEDDDSSDEESDFDEGEVMEDDGSEDAPIEMRKLFESTCKFVTCLKSNESGELKIDYKLADNLTSYKIWVIAEANEKYFGFGESSVIAKLPFSIRDQNPSFLNFGDLCDLNFNLTNTSDYTLKLKAGIRGSNHLKFTGDSGNEVYLPKQLRASLDYPVIAKKVGNAKYQIAASAGKFCDAMEKNIEIYSPSLVSNFVIHGSIDEESSVHIQEVIPPEQGEVYPGFGGLEIQTSSTIFQQLTDAFLYVYRYPYECIEQTASRILSIYSMIDIVEAFKLKDIDKKPKIESCLKNCLSKLAKEQMDNGGFGFWGKSSTINIYLSIFAANAVIRTRQKWPKLFSTPSFIQKDLQKLIEKCKTFTMSLTSYIPLGYRKNASVAVRAQALYTLALYHQLNLLKEKEINKCFKNCEQLFSDFGNIDQQTNESKAWLMYAFSEFSKKKKKEPKIFKLLTSIYKCISEEKETAFFNSNIVYDSKFSKRVMLGSNIRENGLILEVLCHICPTESVIIKLAKHLLKLKKYGKWGNTQENVFVLIGLTSYFNIFEKTVPDFTTNIWCKNDYCGEVKFKGRETDLKQLQIPMKTLFITDEEKEKITKKRKQLEIEAEKAKKQSTKRIEHLNKMYEEEFGKLFSSIKEKYEKSLEEIENSHLDKMKDIGDFVVKGKKEAKPKDSSESPKKKKMKFKLFDFESQRVKTKNDDVDDFTKKLDEKKQKQTKIDEKDVKFFDDRVEKEKQMVLFNETHEDEEEKILNQIKNKQIFLFKKGKGKLYYRMTFKYAPIDLNIVGYDMGFNVSRYYTHIDKQEDIKRDPRTGVYQFKYGALVRVRIQFSTKSTRFHVALEDHLPACLEPLNPALKTTEPIPPENDYNYKKKWYNHINYREERVEAFAEELSPGMYYFSYVCRVKHSGQFICLGTKVEEMYNEEITGLSDTLFSQVEKDTEE